MSTFEAYVRLILCWFWDNKVWLLTAAVVSAIAYYLGWYS